MRFLDMLQRRQSVDRLSYLLLRDSQFVKALQVELALWSAKTQEAVFEINVILLHPEDLEAVALFYRFGILLIAKRFSAYRILASQQAGFICLKFMSNRLFEFDG